MGATPSAKKNAEVIYSAYLVRIWLEDEGVPPRASAQPVDGREVVRFANLDALFAYLKAQAGKMEANDPEMNDQES